MGASLLAVAKSIYQIKKTDDNEGALDTSILSRGTSRRTCSPRRVKPLGTDTPLIRTPLYYGQFPMSRQNSHIFSLKKKTSLRWLDTVFRGQYLPSLSINYVAINKVLKKLPPQLYQIKMKICCDQGCNDIGVVIATK